MSKSFHFFEKVALPFAWDEPSILQIILPSERIRLFASLNAHESPSNSAPIYDIEFQVLRLITRLISRAG